MNVTQLARVSYTLFIWLHSYKHDVITIIITRGVRLWRTSVNNTTTAVEKVGAGESVWRTYVTRVREIDDVDSMSNYNIDTALDFSDIGVDAG